MWNRVPLQARSSWTFAFVGTAVVALIAIGCVTTLYFSPVAIDSVSWEILDKRWIIAAYLSCVALAYIPLAFKRTSDLIKGCDRASSVRETAQISKARFCTRCIAALAVATAVAVIDSAAQNSIMFEGPFDGAHEGNHLGALQAISRGATPYTEATEQYGPGYQIASYGIMRHTEFSLRGFRASFVSLNIVAEAIRYTIMLVIFGWFSGALAIVLSLFYLPPEISTFSGWGILFRWFAPMILGLFFASVVRHPATDIARCIMACLVGVLGGFLAWFSQENLLVPLAAVALIALALFGRGRISVVQAMALYASLAVSHVLTFLTLLGLTVGFSNLPKALNEYFRVGTLWARGLANTPWKDWDTPWTIPYYATPYVVIAVTVLALYSFPRIRDERKVGNFLGVAAATATLVVLILMRSDLQHFLGPMSGGLPALLALSVTSLPQFVSSNWMKREALRAALVITLAAIYIVPLGGRYIWGRLSPDFTHARLGLHQLFTIARGRSDQFEASVFETRLGWEPKWDNPCCRFLSTTYADIRLSLHDVREVVGNRRVYFGLSGLDSAPYFLGDFTVGTLFPSLRTSIYTKDDLQRVEKSLADNLPECAIAFHNEDATVKYVRELFGKYTEYPIHGGVAFCKH